MTKRGLDGRKGVAFDGIRGVGELDIVVMLELCDGLRRERTQAVEARFLGGDLSGQDCLRAFAHGRAKT